MKKLTFFCLIVLTSLSYSESLFNIEQNPQFNLLPMNIQETLSANITEHNSIGVGSGFSSSLQYENGAPISGIVPLYITYQYTFEPNPKNTPFVLVQIGTTYFLQMDPATLMMIAQNPQALLTQYVETYIKFGVGINY